MAGLRGLLAVVGAVAMLAVAMPWSGPAAAAESGGGSLPVPEDRATEEIEAVHPAMVERSTRMGLPLLRSDSEAARAAVARFQYPLRSSSADRGLLSTAISNHVDLDPSSGILDFDCGRRSYDGHGGTDIFLWPFTWTSMKNREVQVVAALGGTIIDKQDGAFDGQCSWSGNPPANYVIIRHDNGLLGYYWHMKKGSVTGRAIGSTVKTGDILGYVGSSGFSTGPHLHFEIRGADGRPIEPASGQCNSRASSWTHQPATIDTAILDLLTHSEPPVFSQCADLAVNIKNRFEPGERVFMAVYLRDQPADVAPEVWLYDPKGQERAYWRGGSPQFYVASWWWNSLVLPSDAPKGVWRLRAAIAGRTAERGFTVATSPGSAKLTLSVANPTRTARPGKPVRFDVTLRNAGSGRAIGCRLSLDRPILADVTTRGPGSSTDNKLFTVPAKGRVTVRLTVAPRTGFSAKSAIFPVRASCTNGLGAVSTTASGRLVLSSP